MRTLSHQGIDEVRKSALVSVILSNEDNGIGQKTRTPYPPGIRRSAIFLNVGFLRSRRYRTLLESSVWYGEYGPIINPFDFTMTV